MNNEQRYAECLAHVVKFIGEDSLKPLKAHTANKIQDMCREVLAGKTTEEAIDSLTNQ